MPHPIPTPSWWQRLRARRAAPAGPDAADMGTAFGLDMTLPPLPADPARAAVVPRRRSWWARTRRR